MKRPNKAFNHDVEFTRAKDGRWIARIADLPGVQGCARTRKDALAEAETMALKALVQRMASSEK